MISCAGREPTYPTIPHISRDYPKSSSTTATSRAQTASVSCALGASTITRTSGSVPLRAHQHASATVEPRRLGGDRLLHGGGVQQRVAVAARGR